MTKYIKASSETLLGSGTIYIEVIDGWASRQIDIVGDRWFSSAQGPYHELGVALADQYIPMDQVQSDWEISKEEFEEMWTEALRRFEKRDST